MFQAIRNIKIIGDILILLWVSGAFFIGKQAEIERIKTVALAIFLVVGIIIWFLMNRITRRVVKKKIREIDSYDYKMFFDINSDQNVFLDRIAGLFSEKERIRTDFDCRIMDSTTDAVWAKPETKKELMDEIDSLLQKDSSGIQCKRIANEEKKGKCIIECIFVPLDKDDNTLLINRLDFHHPFLHQENMMRLQKPLFKKIEYSMISFSPLPNAFLQKYDPLDIYGKEVRPSKEHIPEIDFQGVVLRRMKMERQEDSPIYYLMVVYTAKYDVSFKMDNGIASDGLDLTDRKDNTDWRVIKDIFTYSQFESIPKPGRATALYRKIGRMFFNVRTMDTLFFEKDHDEICGAVNWKELNGFCNSASTDMQIKEAEEAIIRHFYAEKCPAGK